MLRGKNVLFQFKKFLIEISCPIMPVFRFLDSIRKMKNCRFIVVLEKLLALLNRRHIRRTGSNLAILFAAKHALHPHPMGYNKLLRINPLEIRVSVALENRFKFLLVAHQSSSFLINAMARNYSINQKRCQAQLLCFLEVLISDFQAIVDVLS